VDLNKLNTSDKVVVGSGLLLFIAYFLPWFKYDFGPIGGSVSFKGGDIGFLWATLPMLLGLVAVGVVIANKLFDVTLPDLPIPWGQAFLAAGGLAALLVVLKLLTGYHSVDRAFGLFIATIAALGLAAGGFLKFQEGDAPSAGGDGPGAAPF
jgi:hypothetical protein